MLNGEIFDPIITILAINEQQSNTKTSLSGVIDWINQHDKPLSLYCYTLDKSIETEVVENTSSGALVFTDFLINLTNGELRFGGVGKSGIGNYHPKCSQPSPINLINPIKKQ